MRFSKPFGAIGCALLVLGLASGCQKPERPDMVLNDKQMERVRQHEFEYAHNGENIPEDAPSDEIAPKPEYNSEANFEDKITFLGFTVGNANEEEPLVAGEEVTFKWYWRAEADLDKDWKVFVHFDSKNTDADARNRRQNLDHTPIDGLYPTSKWEKGKVYEDVQKVTIKGSYPPGPATPYVGFYIPKKRRLKITNNVPKTDDNRVKAPTLRVENPSFGGSSSGGESGGNDKPTYAVKKVDSKSVSDTLEVDGQLEESFWSDASALELSPFGAAPDKKTDVKALRTDDHLLVGARMTDEHVWSTKRERDSDTWTEEVIEMFVDVDGDSSNYLELQVNPLGTVFDANFKEQLGSGSGARRDQIDRAKEFDLEGLDHAVHVEGTINDEASRDEFWSVELKIPLASIPGIDSSDDVKSPWAVNFYRFDLPDGEGGNRKLSYAWNTEARGNFHQVSKFGRFSLEEPTSNSDVPANPKLPKNEELLKGIDRAKENLRGSPGPPKLPSGNQKGDDQ